VVLSPHFLFKSISPPLSLYHTPYTYNSVLWIHALFYSHKSTPPQKANWCPLLNIDQRYIPLAAPPLTLIGMLYLLRFFLGSPRFLDYLLSPYFSLIIIYLHLFSPLVYHSHSMLLF
jgi:hypothetical protein